MAWWGTERLGLVGKRPGNKRGTWKFKGQLYYSPHLEVRKFQLIRSRVWVIQGPWELECRLRLLRHFEAKLIHVPTEVVHDDVRWDVSLVIGSPQFYQLNSKVVLFIKNILNECEGMARRLVDCKAGGQITNGFCLSHENFGLESEGTAYGVKDLGSKGF